MSTILRIYPPEHIEVSLVDLQKKMLPDDDYPLLYAAQRLRDEDRFIDTELFRLLDHPEAEDFAISGWIDELLTQREKRIATYLTGGRKEARKRDPLR
jgi:hypothetical protein